MELTEKKTYSEFKHELDTELTKASEGFVRIGYLLKIARDTDILAESGYDNVNDFAAAEYNIDKSQVSRFININNRFSEGGYSDRLMDQYKDYGYAKLAMMLTLPDAVVEEITPAYSKSDIQSIKEEIEAEEKITPIETYLEGEKETQQSMPSLLAKVVNQIFHDDHNLFKLLHNQIKNGEDEDIKDTIAPSGDSFHSVRIQGIGRKFLTTKEGHEDVAITDARTGEKELYTWSDVISICRAMVIPDIDYKDNWEQIYEEEYPDTHKPEDEKPKEPVKPQEVKSAKKEDKKKPKSKVTKAKVTKAPVEPVTPKEPEVKQPEVTEEPVTEASETLDAEPDQKHMLMSEVDFYAKECCRYVEQETYSAAIQCCENMINTINKLKEMDEDDEE